MQRRLLRLKNNKVLVLFYHRINVLKKDYHQLCVSPANFRQQMQYLKEHYLIARFDEDWEMLDSDAVVITFDDGYCDNLEFAVPILDELQVPATIFVSTGTMDQLKEMWWDELEALLLVGEHLPTSFRLEDDEFGYIWDTSTWELRLNCYMSIHHLMKNFTGPDKREEWMNQLWHWRGMRRTARKENLTVSEDECRRLVQSQMISVGAHTVNHPSLAVLSREEQDREIRCSIDRLSNILGERVTLFSYPFGSYRANYNEDSIEICKECGIIKAASTDSLLWNPTMNLYQIPRRVVRNWNLDEFKFNIKKYWEGA